MRKKKSAFLEELVDVIRTIQVEDILICGDFSCVLDSKLDVISITSGGKHAVSTVKTFNLIFDLIFIDDIFSDFDLYDKWIFFFFFPHGDSKDFTWSKRTPFVARRLDYILSSSSVFDKIIDYHIIPVRTSDH